MGEARFQMGCCRTCSVGSEEGEGGGRMRRAVLPEKGPGDGEEKEKRPRSGGRTTGGGAGTARGRMHLIFSEARRSLSFTLGRSVGRTRNVGGERESGENNLSWLLAGDVQREENHPHSLIHFGEEMAPGGDERAAAAAAAVSAADCTVVVRWRRLESSPERCIPPAAGGLIRLGYSEIRSATRDFHPGLF